MICYGSRFKHKLHQTYTIQAYDNSDVWAGNLSIELDGISYSAVMARAFLKRGESVEARMTVELYLADMDLATCCADEIDARMWTDANDRGIVDENGDYHPAQGSYVAMSMVTDPIGNPVLSGNNLIFESELIHIYETGVFHYTVEFSADDKSESDMSKTWVSVNDIALNKNGVVVIVPERIRQCLSITEVCVRKVGASLDANGQFVSGTFDHVIAQLAEISTDVIYLLPFFEPGFGDVHTGEDVRKGDLGSVYAVKDFYRIDPDLVTPPEKVDLGALVSDDLIVDQDLEELLTDPQRVKLGRVDDFSHFDSVGEVIDWVGRDKLIQLIGRAELRKLTRSAHALGKQVIFDLVLMQTSRDSPLIEQHPEWYVMDEFGKPCIHQIAWLVYSDVALLKLQFNEPLQNYLAGVAPYWMQACDLDGVRIDASQTVDRPFLKQIKNRINAVKFDAIVLGETLCALDEAVDIPVDMIYALLVDFHRDAEYATQYIDFLEHTSGTFVPRTVAMAYFENHDSPRATKIWRDRYDELLGLDKTNVWNRKASVENPALTMALLRNLQCSLINATAGNAHYANLAYAIEWGSEWGEEVRTDFEEPTLLHPARANKMPNARLVEAYRDLQTFVTDRPELQDGPIYFYRSIDDDDRILGYVRYTKTTGLLVAHNLDPSMSRHIICPTDQIDGLLLERVDVVPAYDTYRILDQNADNMNIALQSEGISVHLQPLQSVVLKLVYRNM